MKSIFKEIGFLMTTLLLGAGLCLRSCTKTPEVTPDPTPDPDPVVEPDNPSGSEDEDTYDGTSYTLSVKDALNRTMQPTNGDKDGKYVGLFYFLWCGVHSLNEYDVNWLLTNYPDQLWAEDSDMSRNGVYHYWGEPLFGYYHMSDEWVITRHVEMFVNAGVDFLGLDVTNAVTYDSQVRLLLNTLLKFQNEGFKVPQVMFLTRSSSVDTICYLYNLWYCEPKYDSLWFAPNGKPMISGSTQDWTTSQSGIKDFFDLKYYQWPTESVNALGFPWMEFTYPQPLHGTSGVMSVSIAQHYPTLKMSTQSEGCRGRSYNFSTETNVDDRVDEGLNFQSQWTTALSTSGVNIVFVTGWNEWQAIKSWDGSVVYFVDEFNTSYSRDAEPMKDGYGDNYYLQLAENIRSFKTTGTTSQTLTETTIDIDGDISQWDNVSAVYRDFEGDAIARNYSGSISSYYYTDNSNRNDIVKVKVAHDATYAYFYVETASDITEYESGTNWMNILVGGKSSRGFEAYDYVINTAPDGDSTSVCKFSGDGFDCDQTGTADLRVSGNVMQVRVALTDIGVTTSTPYLVFKVCDNITDQGDIMDYYISGDSAPLGRFSYTYGY